ncbi:MAG: hypothetical protein J5449_03405 [Oscillospiraceae bacterium]|nr:hypothetical protein [Oscillospiraceae bacterium]
MESALILVELTKIRALLTVFVVLVALALVAALAVAAVYLLHRCDKLLDAAIEESERQSGKTPL